MTVEKGTFERALALGDTDPQGTCVAQIGPEWSQGRAAYGGLVAALMSRALERQLPAARSLRSVVVEFVAPVEPGSVTIQANVLRSGRALTHGEARIVQKGAVCAILLAAYGEARATSLSFTAASAPVLDPPEALLRLPYLEGVTPSFSKHFELRFAGNRLPFTAATRANVSGYVRYAGGGPTDAAGVLGLVDAWPPAVLPMLKKFAPASTVTWMLDIIGDLPARGTHSDAFYRYDAEGVAAEGGYASCEARLWAPDGKLVAASRQMVVEFS